MLLARRTSVLVLVLLLSRAIYPCSMVFVGGFTPTKVRQPSGTVIGSGRRDLMGHQHDAERSSITVPNATVSVKIRTDTAFFKESEVHYPPGTKHSAGLLKEWTCGNEVSQVQTDAAGNFTFTGLEPGKYCLDIIARPPENVNDYASYKVEAGKEVGIPLHASFLIDVSTSAPKATLTADISPLWPDCSGGSFLKLISVK
jgi:hypothetical protein